ncbi:MAG: hypothetical protein MUE72_10705 [Chitinophagaceae bacterium]|nr:hypothetical protein [Chitinophagaceae bacterium]
MNFYFKIKYIIKPKLKKPMRDYLARIDELLNKQAEKLTTKRDEEILGTGNSKEQSFEGSIINADGYVEKLADNTSSVGIKGLTNRGIQILKLQEYNQKYESVIRDMTTEEFFDRVHWAIGEGNGQFAKYYAWAISNNRKVALGSNSWQKQTEDMWKRDQWRSYEGSYPDIRKGKNYGTGYKMSFWEARTSAQSINEFANQYGNATQAIEHTIKAHLNIGTSLVGSAIYWLGGKDNADAIKAGLGTKYDNVTFLSRGQFYHTFYNEIKK